MTKKGKERKISHRRGADGKKSPTYISWESARRRCTDPNHRAYPDYGGRGISFDPRWKKFANFLADMGERPDGCTLDREDGSKDYSKSNCTWSNLSKQNRNRRPWPFKKSRLTGRFIKSKKKAEAAAIGSDDQESADGVGEDTNFEF